MPKNSSAARNLAWKGVRLSDPRVVMRALIGALLAANLTMAVIVFKPFGGSAEDLRREQQTLSARLRSVQTNLDASKRLVDKMQTARTQGDEFLAKYIMDRRSAPEITVAELHKAASDAGMKELPAGSEYDPIEGSDTLEMMSITGGFEGSYAALTKLVNLLDKSQRFFIIDSMQLNAPQQQNPMQAASQLLSVQVKVITFVRDESGAGL
ncbi:MAG TPA: GspMb/PilO family protein [Bryobacteraceae bacterium]|nr:GspMb/PilO family protein [Bryobacteraceae bacterium]